MDPIVSPAGITLFSVRQKDSNKSSNKYAGFIYEALTLNIKPNTN